MSVIKTYRQLWHEQVEAGKVRLFDLDDYQLAKLKRLKEPKLKEIHNNLRKITLSRIRGLQKAGLISEDEANGFRLMPTYTQIETNDRVAESVHKYAEFLSAPWRSTVTGKRVHEESTIEGLNKAGFNFVNKKNIKDFSEFQREATDYERAEWYSLWNKADESGKRPFAIERYFYEFQLNKGSITLKDVPKKFHGDFFEKDGVFTLRKPKR